MEENQINAAATNRREGRALACDGLLASQFGKRPSQAGAKAMEKLRAAEHTETPPLIARSPTRSSLPRLLGIRRAIHLGGNRRTDGLASETDKLDRKPFSEIEPNNASQPSRWAWVAFAACFIVLLGGTLYLASLATRVTVGIVEAKGPGVLVTRAGKKLAVTSNLRLRAGDIINTPRGSSAIVQYRHEATRMVLGGLAALKLENTPHGQRVVLLRGNLEVTAAPQAPGRSLTLATSQAVANVLGTHFILVAKQSSTWLEVLEGSVALTRPEDGAEIKVGPRQYVVAASGLELVARPDNQRCLTPYCISPPQAKGVS